VEDIRFEHLTKLSHFIRSTIVYDHSAICSWSDSLPSHCISKDIGNQFPKQILCYGSGSNEHNDDDVPDFHF
jgi:hypothetical protein